jgi:hypothetical protein
VGKKHQADHSVQLVARLMGDVARLPDILARFLEKSGFLERDAEASYLALEPDDDNVMVQLQGHSITYRIAVGPQQGRKVFTLQTLPPDEDCPRGSD